MLGRDKELTEIFIGIMQKNLPQIFGNINLIKEKFMGLIQCRMIFKIIQFLSQLKSKSFQKACLLPFDCLQKNISFSDV